MHLWCFNFFSPFLVILFVYVFPGRFGSASIIIVMRKRLLALRKQGFARHTVLCFVLWILGLTLSLVYGPNCICEIRIRTFSVDSTCRSAVHSQYFPDMHLLDASCQHGLGRHQGSIMVTVCFVSPVLCSYFILLFYRLPLPGLSSLLSSCRCDTLISCSTMYLSFYLPSLVACGGTKFETFGGYILLPLIFLIALFTARMCARVG